MLISNSTQKDPEIQRQQALARVYALLLSLPDDPKQPKTVDGELCVTKLPKDASLISSNQKPKEVGE